LYGKYIFKYEGYFYGRSYISDDGIYYFRENGSESRYFLVNKEEIKIVEDVSQDEIVKIEQNLIYYMMPELREITGEYKELFRQYKYDCSKFNFGFYFRLKSNNEGTCREKP
jgi:hypothetical protein